VGHSYQQSITAVGGTGPVTLSVSGATNSTGLLISGNGTGTITISGTPTQAGTITFTITPADVSGSGPNTQYSLTVNPAVTPSPPAAPTPEVAATPDQPAPYFSNAVVIGTFLIFQGAGVPGGIQVIQVPLGSLAFFADVNGDGQGDVILFLSNMIIVLDGQTGQMAIVAIDLNGDGFQELVYFSPDGTMTVYDGRTGQRL
jgi:hypothetical protein